MSRAPITVAATSTLAMVRTAESRGVTTADLLRAAGVARDLLDDPDARLPGPTVLAIWSALRERTGDPALQLVAPACLPFGAYRVIDYLVGASATVGDGMHRFASYFRLIADAVTLTISDDDGEHALCLAMADGGAVPPVYVDYVFAALVTRIRMRIRPGLRVLRVELRQAEPPEAAPYAEVFRAPVLFGMAADRLCFSAEEWRAPMDSADASLARLLEDHARILAERIRHEGADFLDLVRKAITTDLPNGASANAIARALNVSPRTLQRKLALAGTTFREVSEAVRSRLAQDYLADPRVSIAEVAMLLGFSEQASFNRAFRRWTRESPGRWRRRRAGILSSTPARGSFEVRERPGAPSAAHHREVFMHSDTTKYNETQAPGDRAICQLLAEQIERGLPEAENKIWHAHPVWFIDGNPIVGYSKLKNCVRLLFWSGQSFKEGGLEKEGSFKAAEVRYTAVDEVDPEKLQRWLSDARDIQWDYKNLVRRKGQLQRLK